MSTERQMICWDLTFLVCASDETVAITKRRMSASHIGFGFGTEDIKINESITRLVKSKTLSTFKKAECDNVIKRWD